MKNQYNERSGMFWSLFKYINGGNDRELDMEMTAPVLLQYVNTANELISRDSTVNMTMKLYLPKINQEDPPVPTNPNVTLSNEDSMDVATIRFGGWAYYSDYINYRDKLIKNLGADAANYDMVNIIAAGYDSPFNFIGRRNEVWLKKIN